MAPKKPLLLSPSNPKVTLSPELKELLRKPYRGWADGASSLVRSTFGEYLDTAKVTQILGNNMEIEYELHTTLKCIESECAHTFECRAKPNQSKLVEHILACPFKSDDTKLKIANLASSAKAKAWLQLYYERKRAATSQHGAEASSSAAAFEEELKRPAAETAPAGARQAARQQQLEELKGFERPLTKEQLTLALFYLGMMFYCCRIAFLVVESWPFRMFIRAIKPSFEAHLPSRRLLGGPMLTQTYEEVKQQVSEKHAALPGKPMLGVDGHRTADGRVVETLTEAKLGISTYLVCKYMKAKSVTGKSLRDLVTSVAGDGTAYLGTVMDNTAANLVAGSLLAAIFPHWIILFCAAHVIDLLIEDIAKLSAIAATVQDVHFIISFIKKHPLVYGEFIELLEGEPSLPNSLRLHLFPITRFGYLDKMIVQLTKMGKVFDRLAESPLLAIVRDGDLKRCKAKKRKSVHEKWARFIQLLDDRNLRKQVKALNYVIDPIAAALHYLEADSSPASHIYPLYQAIYDHVNQVWPTFVTDALSASTLEAIKEAVEIRYKGKGAKVGLIGDAHLASFLFDPAARAAADDDGRLVTSQLVEAANRILTKMHHGEASMAALMQAQTVQYAAGSAGAYSTYIQAARQLYAAQAKAAELEARPDDVGPIEFLLRRLRKAEAPTLTWSLIQNSPPPSLEPGQAMAFKAFTSAMINLGAVVAHIGGVERAGKGYGLVAGHLRHSLLPEKLDKLIFLYANMKVCMPHAPIDMPSFDDFAMSLLEPEEVEVIRAERPPGLSEIRLRDNGAPPRAAPKASELPTSEGELSLSSGDSSDDSSKGGSSDEEPEDDDEEEEEEALRGSGSKEGAPVPDGYVSVLQAPLQLSKDDVGRCIMAVIRRDGKANGLLEWGFGKLNRYFEPGVGKYGKMYNFDVHFSGERGARGLKLENNGELTAYDGLAAKNAPEGTWFFVTRSE